MMCNQLNDFDVPSLAQVFELFESNNLILYLEMKDKQVRVAEECCRLVEEYGLKDRVIFECFEHSALQTVKSIDPGFRIAPLFHPQSSFILKKAIAVGADEIALHHRLTNKRLTEKARLANLNVVTWTVDDPAWITHARTMNLHALITNDPAALITARDAI
jgi:glycerophosphoryl diester phosphodiesterase